MTTLAASIAPVKSDPFAGTDDFRYELGPDPAEQDIPTREYSDADDAEWAAFINESDRDDDYAAGIEADDRLDAYMNDVAESRELDARAELYAGC